MDKKLFWPILGLVASTGALAQQLTLVLQHNQQQSIPAVLLAFALVLAMGGQLSREIKREDIPTVVAQDDWVMIDGTEWRIDRYDPISIAGDPENTYRMTVMLVRRTVPQETVSK